MKRARLVAATFRLRPNRAATVLVLLCTCALLFAQTKAPPFFLIPDEGKVYIILASPPREMVGFNIYRQARSEKEPKLLNPEPIKPITDPLVVRDILDEEEFNWIASALKAEDEFSVLRRLRDPGIGGALALVSKQVATILGKLYVDSLVKTGEEYTYRIAFINYKEEEFLRIDEKVKIQKHKAPEKKVENVTIAIEPQNLRLDWRYPKWRGDKTDIVVGFNIYRKTDDEKDFKTVLPFPYLRTGEKLFYLDKNVEEGRTYQYYLTPVDLIGGEGPKSEIVIAKLKDISPPSPPLAVTATPEEGKIVIQWEPSDDEDVVSYNIYRSWSIHGKFTKLNPKPIPKDEPMFVDNDVVSGGFYVYRVSAIDDAGLEGKHSTATFGSPKDTTPPPSVFDLKAEVIKRMVKLTWRPQVTPDLDGYYVYRGETKDETFRLVGPPIPKLIHSFIDSGFVQKGLYPGRTYYYYVSQVDIAFNESKRILIEVKIPDDDPPMSPALIYCKNNDDGTVEVNWQISLSPDLAKYRVYRQEEGKDISLVKELPPDINTYNDREVEKGKNYFYYVSAVDSIGNESERKKFELTPRDIFPPQPPKGLKVIYKEKRVELSWEKVIESDLLGYNLYRSNLPTGILEKLNKEPIKENKFIDLRGDADYYYWVTALDTSGNESQRSEVLRPEK